MGLQRRINRAIDIGVASTPVSPFSPIYFSNHFISTRFFLSFYARVSILFIVQLFFRFFPRIFFFFFTLRSSPLLRVVIFIVRATSKNVTRAEIRTQETDRPLFG